MSRKFKFRDPKKLYFVSYTVIGWIDVFVRTEYRDIIIESWRFCQENKGLDIYAWVIMPSHVHMIIGSHKNTLEGIVRDMKRATSAKLRACISDHPEESRRDWMMWMMEAAGIFNDNNYAWQFWQQHNHPLEISDANMYYRVLNYIHNNPVKSGFVSRPEDWVYSSARDFKGKVGMIELSLFR